MDRFSVSLVISTYNRAAMLADALDSVARSKVTDPSAIEVIVVDNNSSDDTPQVVKERIAGMFPFQLRYVLERRQGLSRARNRGTQESSAPFVAFMDDDQRLDETFLANLEHEFANTGADCIGGPIFYYNAENLPSWLPHLLEHVGQFDGGREVRELASDGDPWLNGGNMAFRKMVLEEIGGYNVELGRQGTSLLASEEYELQERLFAAHRKIVYTPKLVQYHYLRPERRSVSYWRRHKFDNGRTLYRQDKQARDHLSNPAILGAPRWFWRMLLVRDIPEYLAAFADSSEKRLDRQLNVCFRLGQMYEARQMRRRAHVSAKRHAAVGGKRD